MIGSFARGSVTINDPIDGDGTGPIVTGDEWSKGQRRTATTGAGRRCASGSSVALPIVVRGRGINLSVVGTGNVTLNGAGTADDGTYSVNGGGYDTVPNLPFAFLCHRRPLS